jgi:hypothetical protein
MKHKGVQCAACGAYVKSIAMHVKVHGISLEEYQRRYENAPVTEEELKKRMMLTCDSKDIARTALQTLPAEEILEAVATSRLGVFGNAIKQDLVTKAMIVAEERMRTFKENRGALDDTLRRIATYVASGIGVNGRPLSMLDLTKAAEVLEKASNNDGRYLTELLTRVVEDNRAVLHKPSQNDNNAFSSVHDSVPIAKGLKKLKGEDRDRVRTLFNKFVRELDNLDYDENVIEAEIIEDVPYTGEPEPEPE